MINHKFQYKEAVMNIKSDIDVIDELIKEVLFRRRQIEHYIRKNPDFYSSYNPLDVEKTAPGIVKRMAEAGKLCNVGPMAAVAGTISELCVRRGIELGQGLGYGQLALGILIILQDGEHLVDAFRPVAFEQENGCCPPVVQAVSRARKHPLE